MYKLLDKILMMSIDLASPSSYKDRIFEQTQYDFSSFWQCLLTNPPNPSTWPNFLISRSRVACWSQSDHMLLSYDAFIVNPLCCVVTLMTRFFVTWSNPSFSFPWISVPELWCSQSDCCWQYKVIIALLLCMRSIIWPICKGLLLTTFLKIHEPFLMPFATCMALQWRLKVLSAEIVFGPCYGPRAKKCTVHAPYHVTCRWRSKATTYLESPASACALTVNTIFMRYSDDWG